MGAPSKVLILGANGFIGSHLVDDLAAMGFLVRAFDRFAGPRRFKEHNNIEIYKGDFSDDIALDKAMDNIDYLFHCFSATTPFVSDSDPYKDITLNVLRGIQIFEKAVEKKVKKVVYISSSGAVYGHVAEKKSVTEDDVPTPVSPYGIGKLTSEYYLEYFNRKYGLDYIVYRVSNPYGPRQITKNNQGVIPSFLDKIANGERLAVIGDGTSTRDYIYIKDVTRMITETFKFDTKHRMYNIGSGVQTSVNEIIALMERGLDINANVENLPAPKTFLTKTQINVTRFTSEFNMHTTIPIEKGIKELLEPKA